jgi:hypothetical protein
MANEFIARKGIIVLENGAKITGSSQVFGDITASGNIAATNFIGSGQFLTDIAADSVQFNNVLNKPTLVSASSQIDHNSTTNYVANQHIDHSAVSMSAGLGLLGGGDITTSRTFTVDTGSTHFTGGVVSALPAGTVSASSQVSYTGLSDIPAGIVSSSTQVVAALPAGTVSASSQVDHNATTNYVANEHIDHSTVSITAGGGLSGGGDITATRTLSVNSGSLLPFFTSSTFAQVSGDITITAGGVAAIAANSVELGTDTTGNYAASVGASNTGIVVGGTAGEGTAFTVGLDTGSVTFTDGVVKALPAGTVSSSTQVVAALPAGTVSASSQVVASSITGIENYAQLTGSNDFTAVNTFSNTTNSTAFTNGAVVIDGGLGVGKDVNISGSLNVTGLLTVTSMSTQYVTSSQFTVGTSRIILNDDDLVRFAGMTVIDSGSTAASASILWDSLNNHFIYETDDIHNGNIDPHSALLLAGPETYATPGNEIGLVEGRVPVATTDHNLDNRTASSSIRIDFPTRLTHIEAGLYVTGAITSSVGFSGNGANLTDVTAASVAYTNITGLPTLISESSQVSYTGLSNIPAGIVSSSTQVTTLLPAGTVSASSQVDHNSTTNYVANQHIDHSEVSMSAGNGLSGGGNITTSRTISLDTGSTHFTDGVKTKLNADGIFSSSAQVSYTGLSNIPAGIVSSSAQFTDASAPFTGSFSGSFFGNGSGLTGIASNLQAITDGGASTTNQVTLAGGAIIHGVLFTSSSATGIAGPVVNEVVATFATGSYDSANFDYVVKDGTNYRAGTVMVIWNGANSIEFTDTSTNDIGSTTGVNFTPDLNAGNVRLKVTTPAGTWAVKTAVRLL